MTKRLLFFLFILASCSTEKIVEKPSPSTCVVEEKPKEGGSYLTCVDKDGVESSVLIKNGPAGPQGPTGATGPKGEGLILAESVFCQGGIEGSMAGTGYDVKFQYHKFETGTVYMSSETKWKRGEEVVNTKQAAAYFLSEPKNFPLSDGVLSMVYDGKELSVTSQGGLAAKLPCVKGE